MLFFLVGYMGSGKSTFGKRAAKQLNWQFCDLDAQFVAKHNMAIATYFATLGEEKFREEEHLLLVSLTELLSQSQQHVLIACGGGTPCFKENLAFMKQNGKVIYLKNTVETLFQRLCSQAHTRPLLASLSEEALYQHIATHLSEREQFYMQADVVLHEAMEGALTHCLRELSTSL